MENVKIISDNSSEMNVSGIFYVFNSKYYFIYTTGEIDENEYVKLYVVQVCKEIQNTPTGPIDTGYMLGMEISNSEEWTKVQQSITKIVEDKKNNTKSVDIQYLPISMLVNLKIVSKNKFKLMKSIIENNFNLTLSSSNLQNISVDNKLNNELKIDETLQPVVPENTLNVDSVPQTSGEVIIDYRARFFEEQEKSKILEEQIKELNEKLNNIKNIIE